MGKMRGRDKTSGLEGGRVEECSKKVTSEEMKY